MEGREEGHAGGGQRGRNSLSQTDIHSTVTRSFENALERTRVQFHTDVHCIATKSLIASYNAIEQHLLHTEQLLPEILVASHLLYEVADWFPLRVLTLPSDTPGIRPHQRPNTGLFLVVSQMVCQVSHNVLAQYKRLQALQQQEWQSKHVQDKITRELSGAITH